MRFMMLLLLGCIWAITPEPVATKLTRIREVRSKIDLPEIPPISSYILYYKKPTERELVFYDPEGFEVYFQYRKDRFDREALDRISVLRSGGIYQVQGEWMGLLSFRDEYGKKKKSRRFVIQKEGLPSEWCKDTDSVLYFQLKSWQRLDGEDLIL